MTWSWRTSRRSRGRGAAIPMLCIKISLPFHSWPVVPPFGASFSLQVVLEQSCHPLYPGQENDRSIRPDRIVLNPLKWALFDFSFLFLSGQYKCIKAEPEHASRGNCLGFVFLYLIKETFQQWTSFFILCKAKFHVVLHYKCFWASLGVKWFQIYTWWSVSLVEKQRSSYWCCISLKQVTLFTWNVHVGWSGSEAVIVRDFIWSMCWQLLRDGIL